LHSSVIFAHVDVLDDNIPNKIRTAWRFFRDRVDADSSEPYLSALAGAEYAQRNDAGHYMVNRVARRANYEVLNDGRQSVFKLRDAIFDGTVSLRVTGHARSFYDGEAFVGLPLGQLGQYGALVRSESLVFTDDFLKRVFDPADPQAVSQSPVYLNPQGAINWPAEYPNEFKTRLPQLAGYLHYADGDIAGSPGGYYASGARSRYDFHDPARVARGLALTTRDPLGGDSGVVYDAHDLLPVRVTNPAGLATDATYNYRLLQPREVTDINGNIASFEFSPIGLVTAQFLRGKNQEGDRVNPSVRMEYDLQAFIERRQPVFVRSIRRFHHDSETDVAVAERDQTVVSIEYSDGFGRVLQTRTQAEDTLFGDPVFGGGVISPDQSAPNFPTMGRTRQPGDPVNMVVSGWQIYDNKGRVVEKFEPFFAQGEDFAPPVDAQLGRKTTLFYDPRGQLIRTLNPDGSEQLVVIGAPQEGHVDRIRPGYR
jgi:YD repeat-containing protein